MIDRSKFRPTSMFQIHKEVVIGELTNILRYLENVGDEFERKASALTGISPDSLDEGAQALVEEQYFQNAVDFPSILKASTLMTLYSVFEKTLRLTVTRAQSYLGISNTVPYKGGSDSVYFLKVLKTIYGFEISSSTHKKLDEYKEIRNAFIHSGGNMKMVKEEKREKVLGIITGSNDMLLINEQTKDIIIYDRQYIVRFAQELLSFFTTLYNHLTRKYNGIQTNTADIS